MLAILVWFSSAAVARGEQELDLRLHCAWGGGQARAWSGRVSISTGTLSDLQLLGVDPDQPGSIQQVGPEILVRARQPRDYDAVEFTIHAPAGARLRVEFASPDGIPPKVMEVDVDELVAGQRSEPLDETGNRWVLRRAPGDLIRVELPEPRLVFAPHDQFRATLRGHRLGVPADTALRTRAQLRLAGSRDLIWETEYRHRADETGSWPTSTTAEVELPETEGVYNFEIEVMTRRRTAPFTSEKVIAKRRVQLVVISPTNWLETVTADAPRRVLDIDPTQANWWQRLTRLPQWNLLPGARTDGPLGNVKPELMTATGRAWLRIPVGGWQAYPLPIDETGAPHCVTVEFASGFDQMFSVSVVEANAAGKVIPVGLDSAVNHQASVSLGRAAPLPDPSVHRLHFWPRSRSPLLLITNLSDQQPIVLGKLHVDRQDLVPLETRSPSSGQRMAVAFYERPLFPEAVGAPEALDAESGRSLEDWETFYLGTRRMMLQARALGYDGLAIASASEGSTLYPSRHLQPTPKHDRGTYFASGQDPVRKDVLEMMFRMCDATGMVLIPSVEFATPLPELERQLVSETDSLGITLVDQHGKRCEPARGRCAYYNPLDPRVQAAMRNVVRELLERYRFHESFGGICIQLHPDGFATLPDWDWGADARTWERFRAEKQIRAVMPLEMDEAIRNQWLAWRCEQLTAFYQALSREVSAARAGTTLYLAGGRLIDSRPVQRSYKPTLPPRTDRGLALRELGIDTEGLVVEPSLRFLRPRLQIEESTASTAAIRACNEDRSLDASFQKGVARGSLLLHEPRLMRLPSFDEVSPFGKNNTFLSLVAPVAPSGTENRRRFVQALLRDEPDVIMEGGWLLPTGQDDAVREFLEVYRKLPAGEFEPVALDRQPLTIRRQTTASATTIYVVNDSPWQVGAAIGLSALSDVAWEAFGRRTPVPTRGPGNQTLWNLSLQPYELVALRANRGDLQVLDAEVNLPPDVRSSLENQIQQLGLRAGQLRSPRPLSLLENGNFEKWDVTGREPVGWAVRAAPGAVSRAAGDAHNGAAALRFSLPNGSAGLRSDPLVPPASGRLSISLRARSPKDGPQPRLRLVLEVDGKTWYPWSPIGIGNDGRAITGEWKEFVFRVNELPPVKQSFRIGIEVGGSGEILVDDLQLYDVLVLDHGEQNALGLLLTEADRLRRRGEISDCLRLLDSYWPQYLLRELPEAESPLISDRPAPLTQADDTEPEQREAAQWWRLPWGRARR